MKPDTLFKISFVIMISGIVGIVFFIKEWSSLKIWGISHLFYIPIVIVALIEVNKSGRIDKKEKIKWTLAFIFFTLFTSFYYLLAERKNVA